MQNSSRSFFTSEGRSNRIIVSALLTLLVSLVLSIAYGKAADTEIAEILVRFSSQVCYQGKSYAVWQQSDNGEGCEYIVYNSEASRVLRYTSPACAGRPSLFAGGTGFLLPSSQYYEGPVTYTRYSIDGVPSGSLTTSALLVPSVQGSYFYTKNLTLRPTEPTIYDSEFRLLKRFSVPTEVSGDWQAYILNDSLFVLRDGSNVNIYELPHCDFLTRYSPDIGTGLFFYKLSCNSSGTLCAIANGVNVGVIDLLGENTTVIESKMVRDVHITDDGEHLYFLYPIRDGVLSIEEYGFQAGTVKLLRTDSLPLATLDPAVRKARVDTVISSAHHIIVNLSCPASSDRSPDKPPQSWFKSLVIPRPLDVHTVDSMQLLSGLVWLPTKAGGTPVCLQIDRSGSVYLHVRPVTEESR